MTSPGRVPLPIDAHLDEIAAIARKRRALVVTAPPGAGKTTRVPPALAPDGAVLVLEPRRIAARAIARRIAEENGWTVGEEVGWQIRFERRFSRNTRLLIATEGILTARLQIEPLLPGFRTVVLDEFHERSMHADLALALVRQAWLERGDLTLVVMSATLDAAPVAAFLDGAPIVSVPGRAFPVSVEHAPQVSAADAIEAAYRDGDAHLLAFLPGAPEIGRLCEELARRPALRAARILPLHGSLDAEAQDAAIAPSRDRKIVLATNLAETALTVEGVGSVIDTGLHKVVRLDPAVGVDRLEVERISRDSADQRAGRAGRTRAGRAIRLWDARDILRDHREPEIARVDLSAPLLEILARGYDPATFEWFEAPPGESIAAGLGLLARLGAIEAGRLTPLGDLLRRLGMGPRLGRILVATGGSALGATACALLSERWAPAGKHPAGPSDLLARIDRMREAPPAIRARADEIGARARSILGPSAKAEGPDEEILARAVLSAFPDRIARRRTPGSPRLVLASGHGAALARESVVHDGELLVAIDLEAGARGPGSEARVRMASRIERSWLGAAEKRVEHRYDPASRAVRAIELETVDGLVLAERGVPPDPDAAAPLLVEALLESGALSDKSAAAKRILFAGLAFDPRALAEAACAGRTSLPEVDPVDHLRPDARRTLERLAPAAIKLPSGRMAALDYRDDGSVAASAKLQELFGLAESPRLGPEARPVTFLLLAPNGRPVQTTQDLRGFWDRTYPAVRRELRGRYPKHSWPEDPWTAPPKRR